MKRLKKINKANLYIARKRAALERKQEPFICVITPVFDPALGSIENLIKDLKKQTYENFVHILISNGGSLKIRNFVRALEKKGEKRFVYVELPKIQARIAEEILVELGRRRDFALKNYDAKNYLFLDADTSLVDNNFFLKVYTLKLSEPREIVLIKTNYHGLELPTFPLELGRINISNYIFSKRIAKEISYPNDQDKEFGVGNDYRFFVRFFDSKNTVFLEELFVTEGQNRGYKRLTEKFEQQTEDRQMISVFGNFFAGEALEGLNDVLNSHLVGHGTVVEEFEKEMREFIGFKYAVATNSCTNSFWILLRALGLKRGDEVLIPNIQFFGVKGVLELLEINYKVVDVENDVPNLSLDSLRKSITKKTKAIIFLEYGGFPLKVKQIKRYLKEIEREDVSLILDAANSPFTKKGDKYTANEYDFAIYSFDMNKILVTGDGGMIMSNHQKVMEKCRELSYYGISGKSKTGFEKAKSGEIWWDTDVNEPSLKLVMNNLAAAIGLSQLKLLPHENLEKRQFVSDYYQENLRELVKQGKISTPPVLEDVENNLYFYWILVKDEKTRNELAQFLIHKKIYSTVKYEPLNKKANTPNAFMFYAHSLCLPINQVLLQSDLEYIVSNIFEFYEKR